MSAKRSQTDERFLGAKRRKRPNAEKLGIFSNGISILPGEDQDEFDDLQLQYLNEWMPDGATEKEAVFSLVRAEWLKRRLLRFRIAQIMKNSIDPNHPSFDERLGIVGFAAASERADKQFENYAAAYLPEKVVEILSLKFPAANFKSNSKRIEAILTEIATNPLLQPPNLVDVPDAADWMALLRSAATVTAEQFKHELALEERLDAMASRALKRLIQTKAVKQMLAQTQAQLPASTK